MKFLKNHKGTLTFLLVALLVVSCFWIVKSEIRAASLQSRLDEHHNELMNNSDILTQLKSFWRKVQNSFIVVDEKMVWLGSAKSSLMMKGNEFNINMSSGKLNLELSESNKLLQLMNGNSKLSLHQDRTNLVSNDLGLFIDGDVNNLHISDNNKRYFDLDTDQKVLQIFNDKLEFWADSSQLYLSDKVRMNSKGDITFKAIGKNITFGYSKAEDRLYMRHNGTKLFVGKLQIEGGKEDFGAALISKSGEQIQVREEGVFLAVPTPEGTYHINLASKKKFIEIVKGNSIIRMEGEDISIEADGDINITSKNGKVNINGKR